MAVLAKYIVAVTRSQLVQKPGAFNKITKLKRKGSVEG
jgi:hypothetical protein